MHPKHILSLQQGLVMQGRHLDPNLPFRELGGTEVNLSLLVHQWSLLIEMELKPRSSHHSLCTLPLGDTRTQTHTVHIMIKFHYLW